MVSKQFLKGINTLYFLLDCAKTCVVKTKVGHLKYFSTFQ